MRRSVCRPNATSSLRSRNSHCRQQHADARTKSERPAKCVDEQAQVAGVTNDAIKTAGHQRVPRLDRHQPAEPAAEHEDRPEPQRATGGEENDANPTDNLPIEDPEFLPVRVGRQVTGEQADDPKGDNDPAVGTILADAGAQIAATEERDPGNAKSKIESAISAGWEKKAANPPQPRMASPR